MRPIITLLWLLSIILCTHSMTIPDKEIYGIKGSGWSSPSWNWGSAVGTGHDCAAICRQQYASHASRQELVDNLIDVTSRRPENFEEVKLVLGLAFQRGRWDGSDGGAGGYGEVLYEMVKAQRYEMGTDEECSCRLVQDMVDRYGLLEPSDKEQALMSSLREHAGKDYDLARRLCCGLVLSAMGFVESGL